MQIENPAAPTHPSPCTFPRKGLETNRGGISGAPDVMAAGKKVFEGGTLDSLRAWQRSRLACRYLHRGVVGNCWRGGHLRPDFRKFVRPLIPAAENARVKLFDFCGALQQPALGDYPALNPAHHAGRLDAKESASSVRAAEQGNDFGCFQHPAIIRHT